MVAFWVATEGLPWSTWRGPCGDVEENSSQKIRPSPPPEDTAESGEAARLAQWPSLGVSEPRVAGGSCSRQDRCCLY